MKTLLIRTDANSKVGSGHLIRCVDLARELDSYAIETTFLVSQSDSQFAKDKVKPFELIILNDGNNELSRITELMKKFDGIVIDSDQEIFLSPEFQNRLLGIGKFSCLFNFKSDYALSYDLVINPNIRARAHNYSVPDTTNLLLGPKYIIFSTTMNVASKSAPRFEDKKNVLTIFFGASDENDRTSWVLQNLNFSAFNFHDINVVVGGLNKNRKKIEALANDLNLNFHFDTPNILKIFGESKYSIGACGSSTWELAYLNCLCIHVPFSLRENSTAEYLNDQKLSHNLGTLESLDQLRLNNQLKVIINSSRNSSIVTNFKRLIPGRGRQEIAQIISRSI